MTRRCYLTWFFSAAGRPLGTAIGGDVRLEPGAILAALSGAGILAGGVLIRRDLPSDQDR